MRNVNPEWYYGWDQEPADDQPVEGPCEAHGVYGTCPEDGVLYVEQEEDSDEDGDPTTVEAVLTLLENQAAQRRPRHLPSCWLMGDQPGNPVNGLRICTCYPV